MAALWKLLIIVCFEKVLKKKKGKINDRDSSQQHIKRLRGLTGNSFSASASILYTSNETMLTADSPSCFPFALQQ